jgi:hypothetical protein
MTLADLINEVYTITGRSERIAETASAVKSATLKAHQSDYYYKDIFETGVAFDAAAFIQQIDYRTLIPNWRATKYLRKYNNTAGTPGKFIELVPPEMVLDGYNVEREDIYYVAGSHINIKSSTSEQYYLMGCYVNPDITTLGFNSWIAYDHPYSIVYDAAATVFKAIGKDEEASLYRNLVAEQIAMVRTSNITPAGY